MIVRLVPTTTLSLNTIAHLGKRLAWTLRRVYLPDDLRPFEQVWEATDRTIVHWIDDDAIEVSYFLVKGDLVAATVSAIRIEVRVYNQQELFANWDHAEHYASLERAIRLIGAGAPEAFDPTWFDYFRQAFTNEFAIVRWRAVLVSSIPGWPELKEMVDRLALADPEELVRERAASMSAAPVWRS
jgi:hypothetical protein